MTNLVHEKIKKDITENKVVLYMKGTPIFPQCGFSSMSVQIMEHCGCEYKAINVLDDMLIRDGIKEYSDWPTIPQLYVNGEFIGGCDIMREMFEENELQELLKD